MGWGPLPEGKEPPHGVDIRRQAPRCAERPAARQAEKVEVLVQCAGASPQRSAPVCLGEFERALAGARVAEAPGTDRDPGSGGSPRARALVDDAPAGGPQGECDGAAAIAGTGRAGAPAPRLPPV